MNTDFSKFVEIFPHRFQKYIIPYEDTLIETVVDYGRPLELRTNTEIIREFQAVVTESDIVHICKRITGFSTTGRACVEGTLHRISRIVDYSDDIVGLTCRVGRPNVGCLSLIEQDLAVPRSILVLGPPGSGKTSLIRSISRVLSESSRVIVVDPDSEIAGGGKIPHPAVGMSRRMVVPPKKSQAETMLSAVESHYPSCLVVDEIGLEDDSNAILTVSKRGVKIVATAHGHTLEDALVNPSLKRLLGNVKSVTLGDEEAHRRGTQKTVLEREGSPVFDLVVCLLDRHTVRIYHNVPLAVDTILAGGTYQPEERRERDGVIIRTYEEICKPPSPSNRDETSDLPVHTNGFSKLAARVVKNESRKA